LTKWQHTRKGEIEGKIVAEGDGYVDIELSRDHVLTLASTWTEPHRPKGDVVRCATSLLTLVEE